MARFEIAIGTGIGETDVLDWHGVGTETSYQVRDGQDGARLTLDAHRDYYLSVRAMDVNEGVLDTAESQAWYVWEPYAFDVTRYPTITLSASRSFRAYRATGAQLSDWHMRLEAYLSGSAVIDLYQSLGERVLIGSPQVSILQTEIEIPARTDVTAVPDWYQRGNNSHADEVASMMYDCEESEEGPSSWSYYKGCQTNPRKYAMSASELKWRLREFVLVPQTADFFEGETFREMGGAPHVWFMAHAQPTEVRDPTFGLRLGDWIFSRYNILAISPQPGSHAGDRNSTLSGNYYNSIVVGKKSYNYTYAAQSSIDDAGGPRHKPDIVAAASNLVEASSWSVPTLAAAASSMLGLAYEEPLLAGATHVEAMKAIILTGAGKDHLCPESITETLGSCERLPSTSEQWVWSNSETAPIDPRYGVGLFNSRNSFDLLTAGRAADGVQAREVGWDTQELSQGQSASYTFTAQNEHDSFSLALTWHRQITVEHGGGLSSELPDFKVELRDDAETLVARSDDPANNIEHIYLPEGLSRGRAYTVEVTLKSSSSPVRYGIAWQTREDTTRNSPWYDDAQ